MILQTFRLLTTGLPADFASADGMNECVRRLQEATTSGLFPLRSRSMLLGKVSAEGVTVRRHIPFFSNSFTPLFYGRFEAAKSGATLRGRFIVHWFVRAFVAVWLLIAVGFVAAAAFPHAPTHSLFDIAFALTIAALIVINISLRLALADMNWVAQHIRYALSSDASGKHSKRK